MKILSWTAVLGIDSNSVSMQLRRRRTILGEVLIRDKQWWRVDKRSLWVCNLRISIVAPGGARWLQPCRGDAAQLRVTSAVPLVSGRRVAFTDVLTDSDGSRPESDLAPLAAPTLRFSRNDFDGINLPVPLGRRSTR